MGQSSCHSCKVQCHQYFVSQGKRSMFIQSTPDERTRTHKASPYNMQVPKVGLKQNTEEDHGTQTVQKQKQGTKGEQQPPQKKNIHNCAIHQRPG